jgi:hypothetical protein
MHYSLWRGNTRCNSNEQHTASQVKFLIWNTTMHVGRPRSASLKAVEFGYRPVRFEPCHLNVGRPGRHHTSMRNGRVPDTPRLSPAHRTSCADLWAEYHVARLAG